jgi:ParB family transcriptional regulator, chromosome partitioning protein
MASSRKSLAQSIGDSVIKKFIADPNSVEPDSSSQAISIDQIELPQQQPRRYFNSEKMAQLAQSVKEHGILEPLLVRPLPTGKYELVAGERRLRAARTAKLLEVPIVVRELDDHQALQVALLENLQREDLNPVEETEGILQLLTLALNTTPDEVVSLLHQAYNAKQRGQELNGNVTIQLKKVEEVLATVGRFNTESFRSNRLPLLNLPEDVLEALRQGKLEYTKARTIARLKDEQARQGLLKEAIKQNLSLTQIKARMKEISPVSSAEPTASNRLVAVSRKLKGSKLEDPKKQRRLEKLLKELEALVGD